MATPPTIDRETVAHVARLAHLRLPASELEGLRTDMANMLAYVAKLDELNTDEVAPTAHAVDLATSLREDSPHEPLGTDPALAAAPERLGDGFGVPRVIAQS